MLSAEKQRELGLLVLRVGVGAMFLVHGFPKLMGGPAKWQALGGAVGHLGIHFAPTFFGFMAALAEFGGGVCLIAGVLVRPASALMFLTMCVAANLHLALGEGFASASHALELGVVFLSLALMGGGDYRVRIGR